MGALTVALVFVGFTDHRIGRSGTAPSDDTAYDGAGGVLTFAGDEVDAVQPDRREIALTFDDGPDPKWTPEILDVLAEHDVPATFFVVGAAVLDHPELTRELLAAGHDVGAHTFTHADVAGMPRWRVDLELSLTEAAIAGATGRSTSFFRLPYAVGSGELTEAQLDAARAVDDAGYSVVTANLDSRDWDEPGVDEIVRRAMPTGGEGAIVLFHDGGGDRAQTVAALDRYLTELEDEGYRFVTVTDVLDVPTEQAFPTAAAGERWQGRALLAVSRTAQVVVGTLAVLLVATGVLAVLRAVFVTMFARRQRRRARDVPPWPDGPPAVSVVVPAYNESAGIAASVRSLATSRYPDVEVVVVDDGSTDGTAEIVDDLGLPNVRVVRQENQGKPAALNAGIEAAEHDLLVLVDGDTVFEPDTVRRLVGPLADRQVAAVSGNTKVANRRGLLGRWQHLEYVFGFNLDRRMLDLFRCMPTIPGAVGAFRRSALEEVGGVSDDTLAEDTDLTMAIVRAGHDVVYEERAAAWTEAPGSIGALWKQRYRWSYGTMQSMWKHRRAVREGGPLGRIGLPYLLLFQVMLPLLAPVVDLLALYGIVFLDPTPVVGAWLGFVALQLAIGVYAFRLDGERLAPLWALPLQQFVYRQLMYLVVIQSVASAVGGVRPGWHRQQRVGVSLPAGSR